MPDTSADTCRNSLSRCLKREGFSERFYELFMASSPEVREKFRDTDFERQRRVLADALFVIAIAAEAPEDAPAVRQLDKLATRHARSNLDIRPELYALWKECLLQTLEEKDPEFSDAVAAAWRDVVEAATARMLEAY